VTGTAGRRRLRVGVDATPLLGARTGVGHYVQHLLAALAGTRLEPASAHPAPDSRPAEPPGPAGASGLAGTGLAGTSGLAELRATAFTWRGQADLAGALPAGATTAGRRAPARLLQALWARAGVPPVELLAGPGLDVFHGTNFVLPPLRRARGVVTVHDLAYLHLPGTVNAASLRYRDLVPRSVRRAAVVVVPSQATAQAVGEAYAVPADRLVVTPLGVQPEWFAARPPDAGWLAARGLPPEYLLAVGTLEPRKGLDVLVAAYRLLLAEHPDAPPLVLVGGAGWGDQPSLAALPAGRLVLTGYVGAADLVGVVAGARLLAFPSRYEGFGLPPLEAMAAGVPVVASDLPAVREVTGGLARLVPPADADALAGALAAELAGPAGGRQRDAARARAATMTWARCAELTLRAYHRAAAS
jgi:glycosyltransferase involved in cell wall biosynthesis